MLCHGSRIVPMTVNVHQVERSGTKLDSVLCHGSRIVPMTVNVHQVERSGTKLDSVLCHGSRIVPMTVNVHQVELSGTRETTPQSCSWTIAISDPVSGKSFRPGSVNPLPSWIGLVPHLPPSGRFVFASVLWLLLFVNKQII